VHRKFLGTIEAPEDDVSFPSDYLCISTRYRKEKSSKSSFFFEKKRQCSRLKTNLRDLRFAWISVAFGRCSLSFSHRHGNESSDYTLTISNSTRATARSCTW